MTACDLVRSFDQHLQNAVGYCARASHRLLANSAALLLAKQRHTEHSERERDLNRRLRGYPRNHNYRVSNGRLVPSFRLYARLRTVASLYPEPLESFLDVGCCRGAYVMEAAQRPDCRVAVGVDVHAPFIAIAEQVRDRLGVAATFQLATLDDVADRPEAFGGPFQTVLLLGTYHYLFWGSPLCPRAYLSHEEILGRLARFCSGRLIFSARLELGRLPRALREKAQAGGPTDGYTSWRFLEVARQFFDVREAGHLGRDALLVMSKSSR